VPWVSRVRLLGCYGRGLAAAELAWTRRARRCRAWSNYCYSPPGQLTSANTGASITDLPSSS
jgi:hypothetical protein